MFSVFDEDAGVYCRFAGLLSFHYPMVVDLFSFYSQKRGQICFVTWLFAERKGCYVFVTPIIQMNQFDFQIGLT